jgi:hypothetical protein
VGCDGELVDAPPAAATGGKIVVDISGVVDAPEQDEMQAAAANTRTFRAHPPKREPALEGAGTSSL